MTTNVEKSYLDLYRDYKKTLCDKSAEVLNLQREEAWKNFTQKGFPDSTIEEYRHTNLREELAVDYGLNINRINPVEEEAELIKCEVRGIKSYLFFVVNDTFFCPKESVQALEELRSTGVKIGSLHDYALSDAEIVGKYYNKIAPKQEPFAAFNTLFAQDGFFLYVPKGVKLAHPIQLIFVNRGKFPIMSNARNLIIIDDNATAQVLVCTHSMGEVLALSNRLTEVHVGKHATYDHYKLENTNLKNVNLGSLYIRQENNSNVLVNEITLHNGKTRNNVKIDLDGEHCETILCGMAVADCKEHIDNFTAINHNSPNCKSKELYKYVLDSEACGVFSGRIFVKEGAQKTEAYQTNKNVCMKPTARMFTQPQLEIYADDVKCSHGASTGLMDDNALFYLRSRGIPEKEAKMLLMNAFVDDVLENIRIEALKDKIRQLVEKRFRGELSRCAGCSVCG